ncbi:hypothetical protein SAMN06269185_1582 [Natronoarchaeum philippinense]|uniref:DUF2795 domain-containing protein n=1 Tax=Natronoarchaeum philippinense TaxID=558529 RepID=A0A285NTC7_NATPI|nr:hypothetical protein [Natronoarchaeum philippinense]SNZ12267.1 hypothetical protein SAMN06269185_1582 [Natronoarchaeum philippinense]
MGDDTETNGSDSREMGVDFGYLDDALDELSYPVTTERLLDDHGDAELEYEGGSATLAELLDPMGGQKFESKTDVQQAALNMVGDDAIGRKNYSDRTPPATGEDRPEEGAPGQDTDSDQESL